MPHGFHHEYYLRCVDCSAGISHCSCSKADYNFLGALARHAIRASLNGSFAQSFVVQVLLMFSVFIWSIISYQLNLYRHRCIHKNNLYSYHYSAQQCIIILLLLIGGSFWRLQVKPPRTLGGQSKKIEKSYKFSQKSEISSHQFGNSNHNSHWICYLFLIFIHLCCYENRLK